MKKEESRRDVRFKFMGNRWNCIVPLAIIIVLAVTGSVSADENVREVQEKLRDGGFYSGQIDGAYSSELALALTRYQIRNGLPITGQLDVDTSKALRVTAAVATSAGTGEQSSETWRRLRVGGQGRQDNAEIASSQRTDQAAIERQMPRRSATAATESKPALTPPVTASNFSTERVRDYVGAFVLAGLDPHVGAEAAFFADRVQYYDVGIKDRENIRKDLERYDARWPQREFRLAGDITVEPQNGNRARVTFPLQYELRNSAKHSSGKINKTLVLESSGEDFQIVAVSERKAE
jgi:hypothetical protein